MTPEPKVIDKIQKLLRLANSANQHEAALAAARAAELMLEHQLTEAKLAVLGGEGTKEAIQETDIASVGSKIVHWKGLIVRGLCEAFGTSFFWLPRRSPQVYVCSCGLETTSGSHFISGNPQHYPAEIKKSRQQISIRIIGRQTETETVSYMFAYLTKEIDRLADETYDPSQDPNQFFATSPGAVTRKWKESFRLGASEEIYKRLLEQRAKTFAAAKADASMSQALVRIDQNRDAIEKWKKEKHPDLRSVRRSQADPDRDGYSAGRSAGRNVNLGGNKGLGAPPKRIGR